MTKIITLDRADADYERDLNAIIDRVYSWAGEREWSWEKLASKARLATGTVYRIGNRETKLPQFRSVWKLCRAVGASIEIAAPRAKARRAEA